MDSLKAVKTLLSRFKIRLHKIVSNSSSVAEAFPADDRAEVPSVEIAQAPTHRTLGVAWDTVRDAFIIKIAIPDPPVYQEGSALGW